MRTLAVPVKQPDKQTPTISSYHEDEASPLSALAHVHPHTPALKQITSDVQLQQRKQQLDKHERTLKVHEKNLGQNEGEIV